MRRARQITSRRWAIVVLLAASSCVRGKDPATDEKLPPQVALYGVTLHTWEGNHLVASGTAETLTYDRESGTFGASQSLVRFPSSPASARKPGTAASDLRVTAPVATGNLLAQQAEGRGGLVVQSSTGLWAQTPSARFDGEGLVVLGPEPVHVEGPGYSLDAPRFTFYLLTEQLLFEGGVQSRLGAIGKQP